MCVNEEPCLVTQLRRFCVSPARRPGPLRRRTGRRRQTAAGSRRTRPLPPQMTPRSSDIIISFSLSCRSTWSASARTEFAIAPSWRSGTLQKDNAAGRSAHRPARRAPSAPRPRPAGRPARPTADQTSVRASPLRRRPPAAAPRRREGRLPAGTARRWGRAHRVRRDHRHQRPAGNTRQLR